MWVRMPTEHHQNKCENVPAEPRVRAETARGRNSIQLIGKADYVMGHGDGVRIPLCSLPFQGMFFTSVTITDRERCSPRKQAPQLNYSTNNQHSNYKVFSSTVYCSL